MERRCAGSVAPMAVIAGPLALFLHPPFTSGVSVHTSVGRLVGAIPRYSDGAQRSQGAASHRCAPWTASEWPAGPCRIAWPSALVSHSFHFGVVVSIASALAAALVAWSRR